MDGALSRVAAALQQLSHALGRHLELDHNGTLGLEFEGGESCTIEVPSWANLVYLFAPVLQIEAASRAAMLEWALAANLNQIELPGVFLALDRGSDSVFPVTWAPYVQQPWTSSGAWRPRSTSSS